MVGLAAGIRIVAPNYLVVQSSVDADAFREAVDDAGRGRVGAAAVIDVGFATSYALVAASFIKRPCAVTGLGAAMVATGAASDVAENLLLLVGVARPARLSDRTVRAMRRCGSLKWIGLIVGAVVIVADRIELAESRPPCGRC
jgi:hypothetical protein